MDDGSRQEALAALRRPLIDDRGRPRCPACGGPAIRDGTHRCRDAGCEGALATGEGEA